MSNSGWNLPKFSEAIQPRIIRIFLNSDLRSGQEGLTQICKKNGINPSDLKNGEFVFFINTKETAIKGFASSVEAMFFWKREGNKKIPLEVIQLIPKYYGASEFPLGHALREYLMSKKERYGK